MAKASYIITYDNFNNPVENEIPYKEISHIAIYVSQCSEYGWITFADLDKIGIAISQRCVRYVFIKKRKRYK